MARDVVAPGAFRQSLAERGAAGIRMLFQHDAHQPIGVWQELREDARGLYAQGQLALDVEKARDVLALMRAGAIDGLSIGFKATKFRRDAKSGMRRLDKVDLWEISIVTFPMLPGARVAHVKAWPVRTGRADGTGIRALAHAGCWVHALGGAGGAPLGPQRSQGSAGCGRGR